MSYFARRQVPPKFDAVVTLYNLAGRRRPLRRRAGCPKGPRGRADPGLPVPGARESRPRPRVENSDENPTRSTTRGTREVRGAIGVAEAALPRAHGTDAIEAAKGDAAGTQGGRGGAATHVHWQQRNFENSTSGRAATVTFACAPPCPRRIPHWRRPEQDADQLITYAGSTPTTSWRTEGGGCRAPGACARRDAAGERAPGAGGRLGSPVPPILPSARARSLYPPRVASTAATAPARRAAATIRS